MVLHRLTSTKKLNINRNGWFNISDTLPDPHLLKGGGVGVEPGVLGPPLVESPVWDISHFTHTENILANHNILITITRIPIIPYS